MKRTTVYTILILALVGICLIQTSWAGQVISEKDREWAKTVLSREKSISDKLEADTIAVFNFVNKTPNRDLDPFQKGIVIMLITDLSKLTQLTLLERTRIQALIDEMNLGKSGITASDNAIETGKLIGANYLIGGNFLKGEPAELNIASDILNAKIPANNEKVLSEGQYQELLALEKKLAFGIVDALKIKLSEKQKENLEKPLSTNWNALRHFFMGIDMSDQGKYQSAKRYYQKAVELDPGLEIARDAIFELANLKLVPTRTMDTDTILTSTRRRTSTTNTARFDQRISGAASGAAVGAAFSDALTDIRVRW